MPKSNPFKWRHYQPEIILLCTLVFSLAIVIPTSGRNGERTRMGYSSLNDFRWVQQYGAEEKRCRLYLRLTNDSWRVDETCIEVKGKQKYLYRAVDSAGQTLGFWLLRDTAAAKRFFRKAFKAFHSIATGD